jgi:regulator of cell morphogenesis and NO signaling
MPTSTKSIREIMATHPSAAKVLERFEIDLCSQADNSLLCACRDLQLSVDQVLEKLSDAECEESGSLAPDPVAMPIGRLIQYIVRVHHQMVRQELPRLAELAHRLTTQQSGCEPELQRVADLLEKLRADMFQHIQKEEQVLFPYISQMDQNSVIAYAGPHHGARA